MCECSVSYLLLFSWTSCSAAVPMSRGPSSTWLSRVDLTTATRRTRRRSSVCLKSSPRTTPTSSDCSYSSWLDHPGCPSAVGRRVALWVCRISVFVRFSFLSFLKTVSHFDFYHLSAWLIYAKAVLLYAFSRSVCSSLHPLVTCYFWGGISCTIFMKWTQQKLYKHSKMRGENLSRFIFKSIRNKLCTLI